MNTLRKVVVTTFAVLALGATGTSAAATHSEDIGGDQVVVAQTELSEIAQDRPVVITQNQPTEIAQDRSTDLIQSRPAEEDEGNDGTGENELIGPEGTDSTVAPAAGCPSNRICFYWRGEFVGSAGPNVRRCSAIPGRPIDHVWNRTGTDYHIWDSRNKCAGHRVRVNEYSEAKLRYASYRFKAV
jgi:hypothetical protein